MKCVKCEKEMTELGLFEPKDVKRAVCLGCGIYAYFELLEDEGLEEIKKELED